MAYNIFKLHREGIPPLLAGIQTKEQFSEKMQTVRDIWLDYIGGIPERVPVKYETLGETVISDHIRRHIVYDTVYGDKVTAFLLLPLNRERTDVLPGQLPAVLTLHPTNEIGKRGVCTLEGKPGHAYGMELVSRGFVVLAPDAMTSGERIEAGYKYFNSAPFYERHPGWSTAGKNIVDHMQGVDFLCKQPFVDPNRIGVIGHSFGGYNSYFLAGIDSRIKAVVSSCGLSPFAKDDKPMHWGRREAARQAGAGSYTHLPKVTDDLSRGTVPFDFHEIIALAAPVPFMNYSAQSDAIFQHWQSIGDVTKDLYDLYKWLGYEERFLSLMGAKEHSFPPEIRKVAYDFLDRWLFNERNG